MLTDVSLIKVKTLSKKMASQIEVVHFSLSKWKPIHDMLQKDYLRPLGWAAPDMIEGINPMTKAWLIEYEGNLYWIAAPYKGEVSESTPKWMATCCKNLPQIFIG